MLVYLLAHFWAEEQYLLGEPSHRFNLVLEADPTGQPSRHSPDRGAGDEHEKVSFHCPNPHNYSHLFDRCAAGIAGNISGYESALG
jgi:hypothetical protein